MFSKIWMSLKASPLLKSPEPREDGAALRSRRSVMRQLFVTLPMVIVAAKLSSGFNAYGALKSGKKPKTGSKPKTGTNPSPKTPPKPPKTKTKSKPKSKPKSKKPKSKKH
jgi:hypothetical protein